MGLSHSRSFWDVAGGHLGGMAVASISEGLAVAEGSGTQRAKIPRNELLCQLVDTLPSASYPPTSPGRLFLRNPHMAWGLMRVAGVLEGREVCPLVPTMLGPVIISSFPEMIPTFCLSDLCSFVPLPCILPSPFLFSHHSVLLPFSWNPTCLLFVECTSCA